MGVHLIVRKTTRYLVRWYEDDIANTLVLTCIRVLSKFTQIRVIM